MKTTSKSASASGISKGDRRIKRRQRLATSAALTAFGLLGCPAYSMDLLAYWNFNSGNTGTSNAEWPGPISADLGSGTIDMTEWLGNTGAFAGTNINTISPDPSGGSLSLIAGGTSAPFPGNGSSIIITFDMSTYKDLEVSFATRGTSTGFDVGTWSWSLNGSLFDVLPGVNTATRNTSFSLATVDFSSVTAINDASLVYLKYTLDGATGQSGNNRIDNLQINAAKIARIVTWDPPGTTWNTDTGNTNWLHNGNSAFFIDGDEVHFTDAGVGTVNVDPGGVAPNETFISNTTGTYTFTGGSIGGGAVTKTGDGTVVFTAFNTYTGNTNINGGIVSIADDFLGDASSNVSFGGGTLLSTVSSLTLDRGAIVTSGGGTIDTGAGDVTLTGTVGVTGTGTLTKTGSGALFLNSTIGAAVSPLSIAIDDGTLVLDGGGTRHLATQSAASINGDIVLRGGAKRVNFTTGTFSGTGEILVENSGNAISVAGSNSGLTPVIDLPLRLNSLNDPTPGFNTKIGVASPSSGVTNTLTINSVISGDSDVIFSAATGNDPSGSGVLILNAVNTYTGSTTINNVASGVVRLGVSNAIPQSDLTFGISTGNVGALDLNGNDLIVSSLGSATTGTVNGIANTGSASTLTISGSASTEFTGTIGIPANTVNLAGANDDITLVLDSSNSGTLALTRASTYSGGTTISGGTLLANNTSGSATGSGPVVVNSGGTLGGTGSVGGAVTINSGGTLAPGASTGTLLISNLTLGAGSNLDWDLASPVNSDRVVLTGPASNLTVNGGTFMFSQAGPIAAATYTLIDYDGTIGGAGFGALSNATTTLGDFNLALQNNAGAGTIELQVTHSAPGRTWSGNINGNWDTSTANWAGPATYSDANQVVFDDSASGTTTITITSNVEPQWVSFDNSTAKSYTIIGAAINGSAGLTKSNTGTVTLAGTSHGFAGPVVIQQGVLEAQELAGPSTPSSIGAGTEINLGGYSTSGTLRYLGSGTTMGRSVGIDLGGGTLDVASGAATLNVTGQVFGLGGLTKAGDGKLVLSHTANNYAGDTTVLAGTLETGAPEVIPDLSTVSVSASASFLVPFSETIGALSGAGAVDIGLGETLTVGGNGTNTTFGGVLSGGELIKTGPGTLALTNSGNSFDGVTLTAGTLQISEDGNLGNSTAELISTSGTIRFAAAASFPGPGGGAGGRTFRVDGPTTFDTNGFDVTINGDLIGSGAVTKTGAGVLTFTSPSESDPSLRYTGVTTINGGTLRVNSEIGNFTAVGGGNLFINNGGTFHIDNVRMGITTGAGSARVFLNDGGTLLGTGEFVEYNRGSGALTIQNGTDVSPVVVDIKTANAADIFRFGNSIRTGTEPAGLDSSHNVIRVSGPGRIVLHSGGTTSSTTFRGEWQLDEGILQIGPVAPLGLGEPINALGFRTDGIDFEFVPVTINSGAMLAIGVNEPNPQASNPLPPYLQNPVILNGGSVASTAYQLDSFGDQDPNEPVHARIGGDLTVNGGTVLLYNPIANPQVFPDDHLGPRDFSVVADGNTTWNGNLLLDPGSATGAALTINRTGGTVSVLSPSTITVPANATLNLDGVNALSDGTNFVNIVNNSTTSLNVLGGSHSAGVVSGSGNTNVAAGAELSVQRLQQNALSVDGTLRVRPDGGPDGVLFVNSLGVGMDGAVDLNDNDLIVDYMGTSPFNDLQDLVLAGYSATVDPGKKGIVSSTSQAQGGDTILALVDNAAVGGFFTTWLGHPVDFDTVIGKYTYFGDANLDGQVTGDDFALAVSNLGMTGALWIDGDMNFTGTVTGDDLTIIIANLGKGVGNPLGSSLSGSVVPEPGALGLLAAAGVGMLMRRRRAN